MTEALTIVVVERYAGDATGAKARTRLVPWRRRVCGALLGWRPSAGYDPIHYLGARMMPLGASSGGAIADLIELAVTWPLNIRETP